MSHASCPICHRKLTAGFETPSYPFCTPRCKLVDLGNWLGDRYVIAGSAQDESESLDDDAALAALLREPS